MNCLNVWFKFVFLDLSVFPMLEAEVSFHNKSVQELCGSSLLNENFLPLEDVYIDILIKTPSFRQPLGK